MITVVQPAARAAPSFRVIIADGKFQGVRMDLLPSYKRVAGFVMSKRAYTTPRHIDYVKTVVVIK